MGQFASAEAMACRLSTFPVQIDQHVALIDDQDDFITCLCFVEPHALSLVDADHTIL